MKNTDLIIIGAGPGGYETAISAARDGLQTVLIEGASIGGTCLNEGCIPTKCLCRSAEILDLVRDASDFGVAVGTPTFQLSSAMHRKEEVVEKLKEGVNLLLKSPAITVVEGHARFTGPHTVQVNGEEYTAPNILIATGSEAKLLAVPGADCAGVVTAREMLQISNLPRRLCIVGGGVIGLEFASIFKSFGSEVTVVEYAKEVLPAFDKDIAKRLRLALKKKGIVFHLGAAVQGFLSKSDHYEVAFSSAGKEETVDTDLVLMAVGRSPRVADLGLEAAGIVYTPRGIVVDEHLQTNVKGVYAVGDVNGLCPLAHAATAQGLYVLKSLLGQANLPDLQRVPAAVFTVPEVATVGLTEEQAKAQKLPYTIHKSFYRANGKSLTMGMSEGLVKILVDGDQRVIGAHILGAHAADLIHELALAMHTHTFLDDIGRLIHAHPSLSELIHAAVDN